jgi:putative heme iron utilization protein
MVLPEAFVESVIEHMNTDHAQSLRDYAMAYGNLASVNSVILSGLSEKAMTLECHIGSRQETLTIPLTIEIKRPEQVRGVLVSMAKQARAQLEAR